MLLNTTEQYRRTPSEQERERDQLALAGRGESALDIGARDGHYSKKLAATFRRVVALDLQKCIPAVENVAGDVTDLRFPDRSFDLVLCAEVLEHVADVERAAAEIVRVTRRRAVIGVPYMQDLRLCRLTCWKCGQIDPAWGHVHTFDEARLETLFHGLRLERFGYVGSHTARTNAVSVWLMDLAGNPWGTYDQEEVCSGCGAAQRAPQRRSGFQKAASAIAHRLTVAQALFARPRPKWIHACFTRAD